MGEQICIVKTLIVSTYHLGNVNSIFDIRQSLTDLTLVLEEVNEINWLNRLQRQTAVRGPGGNKLRTYRLFKTQWATEGYVKQIVNRAHRAALAKFRCGVAPLRLETGRFGRNRLPVNERICTLCNGNEVEDECHVIVRCPLYQDLREELFSKAVELNDNFNDLSDTDKMKTILSNLNIVKLTARSLFCILERRRLFNCEI
jgi:hypothetical protein